MNEEDVETHDTIHRLISLRKTGIHSEISISSLTTILSHKHTHTVQQVIVIVVVVLRP